MYSGDAVVAFVGPCRVEVADLVDQEDARQGRFIASPCMLHFLVEHFGLDLREAVWRQRMLCRLAADLLREIGATEVTVQGDDVFVVGRKATVSIATRSPVSSVIHLGVNVHTEGAPVPAWGLAEADIEPEPFARTVMERYQAELADVQRATTKVRAVP